MSTSIVFKVLHTVNFNYSLHFMEMLMTVCVYCYFFIYRITNMHMSTRLINWKGNTKKKSKIKTEKTLTIQVFNIFETKVFFCNYNEILGYYDVFN